MKTSTTIFTAFVFLILCISCDEVEDLASFTANTTFNKTISVAVAEDPENPVQTVSETATISLEEDQELQDNLNLIETVRITSLTYEIRNALGNDMAHIQVASITFGNITLSIDDLNIVATDQANTIFSVTEAAQLTAIGNALKNNSNLTVTLNATIENNPINFDVAVTLTTAIEIQPI